MQVKEIMTEDVACCAPETSLQDVARLMVEHDCGAIPVVEDEDGRRPVGIITDRDITCRAVAQGKNPLDLTAADCMTATCTTVTPDMSVGDCCRTFEEQQIRRAPVVDAKGGCCGIVAQADIAQRADEKQTAEVVQQVSQPTDTPSVRPGSQPTRGRSGCC